MKFAITGYGRSGTHFLSQQLNKSEIMQVEHEPPGSEIYSDASNRFTKDNYGEVNNHLRFCIKKLSVDAVGVILRNPRDCYNSSLYKNMNNKPGHFEIFMHSFFMLDLIIDWAERMQINSEGFIFKKIYFDQFTTDKTYLKEIAHTFGCTDLSEDDFTLERSNHKARKYVGWVKQRAAIDKHLGWFIDKYGLR